MFLFIFTSKNNALKILYYMEQGKKSFPNTF